MIGEENEEEMAARIISKLSHFIMNMQENGGEVPECPPLTEDEAMIIAGAVFMFPFDKERE